MISYIDFVPALQKLYPTIVKTIGYTAYDANGNEVSYDKTAVESYAESQSYIAKRAAEYPQITDYIDGVVKGDQAQIDAYIAACQAVKTKYPKPE
jgi:hypothetical protein